MDEAMDLRQLRYFLALAESLDLTVAAKHCGLSASSFARHIGDLEESLGCSLVRRRGNHVSLTAAGQVFLGRARDLLASANHAMGEARATAESVTKVIRLGHYGDWWSKRYAKALGKFRKEHPGLRFEDLELAPADMALCLKRGDIDAAFLEHVDVGLRIDFKIQRIEVLSSVALLPSQHSLCSKAALKLEELSGSTWVVWDERVYPGRRHLLLDAAEQAGFVPCIAWDAESEHALHEQILGGGAVGFAPDLGGTPPAGVTAVRMKKPAVAFPVYLAWRRDAENSEQLEGLARCLLGACN